MDREYREFTQPAELHKAVNMLRGIVEGIQIDDSVGSAEVDELIHWCEVHSFLRDCHPFSEIIPKIEEIVEDGVITQDEAADLCWLCKNFSKTCYYYDDITAGIQFLLGIIHGVMADGVLSDDEIKKLKSWVTQYDFLSGTYPYDEINSLLLEVLSDGRIDAEERERLLAFFSNLIDFNNSHNLNEKDFQDVRKKYSVSGICAVCPEITFSGKIFCFTGDATRDRSELVAAVTELGGLSRSGVSKKTDYLIVGNAGNPCWAYSCYGRKIEEAMELRKAGEKVIIVNENDFWDAVEDARAGII